MLVANPVRLRVSAYWARQSQKLAINKAIMASDGYPADKEPLWWFQKVNCFLSSSSICA
ncbi:MAG: hypothetical protein ACOYIG_13025 [Acetivibrionales bacterium]